jgi:hypothetical protein
MEESIVASKSLPASDTFMDLEAALNKVFYCNIETLEQSAGRIF